MQIGRGRGGFYTYTAIERLLGADIDNLDRIDPSLQTLKPGERIWMTPERYLGHLPGQFWRVRQVQPGRALVLERKPPESPQRAIWSLVLAASGRWHDPTAGSAPQRTASRGSRFTVGYILARWHLLDGAWNAARHQGAGRAVTPLEVWPALISLISGQEPVPIRLRWQADSLTARHHMIVDPIAERRHEQQDQHRDSADSMD